MSKTEKKATVFLPKGEKIEIATKISLGKNFIN
jgi:hypothetical protein